MARTAKGINQEHEGKSNPGHIYRADRMQFAIADVAAFGHD